MIECDVVWCDRYMNHEANITFQQQHAKNGSRLDMPVLFLHAAYDTVCATVDSGYVQRGQYSIFMEALACLASIVRINGKGSI